jgi:hypothetical protein
MSKRNRPKLTVNVERRKSIKDLLSPLSADGALALLTRKLSSSSLSPFSASHVYSKEKFATHIDRYTNSVISKSMTNIETGNQSMNIPEKILLLSLNSKGWIKTSVKSLEKLLLWGVLSELIIKGRIITYKLLSKTPNAIARYGLDVISIEPTSHELFDDILAKLHDQYVANNNRRIASYMDELHEQFNRTIVARVAKPLVDINILGMNRDLDLMIVNVPVYPIIDSMVQQQIRKDICNILTIIEDRYHVMSISPSTPIEGFSPSLYALAALLYVNDDMVYTEVLEKYFASNYKTILQLKYTTGEMITQYENWQLQRGFNRGAAAFEKLYHMICEFGFH